MPAYRSFLTNVAVLGLSLILSLQLTAETLPDLIPQLGISPSGTYSIDGLETIDKVSGNVNYRIPLAAFPPGRAGFSFQLALVYNSQNLTANYHYGSSPTVPPPGTILIADLGAGGGWAYNYNYAFGEGLRPTQSSNTCVDPTSYKIYRPFFDTPDGSRHYLRPYGYSDTSGDGFFGLDANGINHVCTTTTQVSGDLTYFTDDGTYIKVVLANPGSGNWFDHEWRAYFPDGTVVTGVGNQTSTIADRNGNSISISHVQGDGTNKTILADALGRTITIETFYTGPTKDVITQKGFGGTEIKWTVHYEVINFSGGTGKYTCDTIDDQCDANFTADVVSSIDMPSPTGASLTYQFGYSDAANLGWGNLNSVTFPSGASISYEYMGDGESRGIGAGFLSNPVTKKTRTTTETADGGSTTRSETWTYAYYVNQTPCNEITAPDGGVEKNCFDSFQSASEAYSGTIYETVLPSGEQIERRWLFNRPFNDEAEAPNLYLKTEVHTVPDNINGTSKSGVTDYQYDKNGNVVSSTEYDWMSYSLIQHDARGLLSGFPPGVVLRKKANTYVSLTAVAGDGSANDNSHSDDTAAYWNPNSAKLRGLVSRIDIGPVGRSVSDFTYDTNGNVTQELHWDSSKAATLPETLSRSTAMVIDRSYDSYGNQTKVTDGRGISTVLKYDDNHLYLTDKVQADGKTEARTTTYQHDWDSGLITTSTDSDNNVTTSYTYDMLGRITLLKSAAGTPVETRIARTYEDGERRIVTKQDVSSIGDGALVSIVDYDQLGRIRLTRQLEGASQSIDDDSAGIKVQSRYLYGGGASYKLQSNPYRASTSAGTTEEPMGWTVTTYDKVGRVTSVQTFDGAGLPSPWGSNSSSSGITTMTYNSETTTITDQAGKKRTTARDALGRPVQVTEDPDGLKYVTTYSYDAQDNLTAVHPIHQGSQSRTFGYNSLGRLVSASNPESGIIMYGYDDDGNLVQKTDARSVKITYTYDSLNRLKDKSYSDVTPKVTYTYDDSGVPYSKGRLTSESSTSSTSTLTYDALGRVVATAQTTDGKTYNLSYAYDRSGRLTSETYPSGRVVTTTYDGSGRPSQVSGGLNGSTVNYVSGVNYAPNGAEALVNLGNGMAQAFSYNGRLQVSSWNAALNNDPGHIYLKEDLDWGTANDNGNLNGVSEYNGGPGYPTFLAFSRTFTYDGVNRLSAVSDNGGYTRNFSYDALGNMWISGYTGMTPIPGIAPLSNVYDKATNRIQGQSYDAAGNVLQLTSMSFSYDAEDRQKTAVLPGVSSESYLYDGEGRRVEKIPQSGLSTVYVYDAFGQIASEYTLSMGAIPPCHTCYLSWDHLGSTRLVTDQSANIVARHDYLPFGEEIPAGVAGRDSTFGASDFVNQKFTGKERDQESGLDYFGARYYGGALGRFTSPDWSEQPDTVPYAEFENPQTLNLYSYARNNPLTYNDPDGHDVKVCLNDGNGNQNCTQMSNEDYAAASQGNAGTNVPTLDQVGMNGNGSGSFNATNITDSNGNAIGTATYVSNGGADYYANRNGINFLSYQTAPVVNGLAYATGGVMAGAGIGVGYGAIAGGSSLITLGSIPAGLQPGAVVGGFVLGEHAVEQAAERGVTLQDIEEAVQHVAKGNPNPARAWDSVVRFYGANCEVRVNRITGTIVTVIKKSNK